MEFSPLEIALLTTEWSDAIPASPAADLARLVVDGRFREALTGTHARRLFALRPDTQDAPITDWFDFSSAGDDAAQTLAVAVACLHAFVQANWTGPDLDVTPADALVVPEGSELGRTPEQLHQRAVAELAAGGEPAYHLADAPLFLRLAQLLLALPLPSLPSLPWWRLRCANVHLQVLDEPVPPPDSLLADVEALHAPLAAHDPDLAGRLLLAEGLLRHRLGDDRAAGPLFVRAARATGLRYELTGALGKRTKWQVTDITQLVLLAESRPRGDAAGKDSGHVNGAGVEGEAAPAAPAPETLALNDDTLLERTEFTSSAAGGGTASSSLAHLDPGAQPALVPLDQAIVLALCANVRNTSPAHGLTGEQMAPYAARVLPHAQNWSVHTAALLVRARLEAHRTRTAERAVLQLQALVDQMPSADAAVPDRLRYAHELALPSKWALERELAGRLLALGAVRSALEIFERRELWEDAVRCHQALDRADTGTALVRALLAGARTEADVVLLRERGALAPETAAAARRRAVFDTARAAKLWCLLGELEPEHAAAHYAHAWALSGETSGRAMRSLGGLHFARREYAAAIPCLRAAVRISPLLARSWFLLGCACSREEDWQGARDAFARCVSLDDDDAESWNNLASAYLQLADTDVRRRRPPRASPCAR
jgi:tetratricopeptide (TPR) repeat protein